jgi:flagellar hook-associated protein 1 FlgK
MTSTFHGLEIGKRSILAQQSALNTTGQNIANANTIGYTRQDAVLQPSRSLANPSVTNGTGPMTIGTGVEVSEIRRIRDDYLDVQYRSQQQNAGYWQSKATALSNLENVFNEPSDSGLSMTLDRFYQSMQELSKQSDSLAIRSVVLANGQAVADSFNSISSGIDQNEKELQNQLSGKVNEINSSLKQVAELNSQIALMTANGAQPNDLVDQRDLALDKLSKLISVHTTPGQNGVVILSVGGVALFNGMTAGTFTIDPQTGATMADGKPVELDGGEVKGLLDTLTGSDSGSIATLRSNVNLVAKAFTDSINAGQAGNDARNLDDIQAKSTNSSAPLDQLLFFVDKDDPTQPPKDAVNMIVNPRLVDSPAKIAAAKSDSIGDGSNASAMANIQHQKMDIGGTTTTIGDFYQMIVGKLGTDIQDAQRKSDTADAAVQQVDNRRQSISGVSIDEEMTNMVRFQQAYNAAAKYVSAIDDMLDKLINGMK